MNQEIRILGYCELGESEILAKFDAEGAESLRNLRGEYTLVIENSDETYVIVSPVGTLHYYYTVQNGKLYHSDKLVEIIGQSGLAWEWDWRAMGDLCQLEHVMENLSLHRHIKKVPPGSVLNFKDGKLGLESRQWVDSIEPGKSDPEEALNALNDEVAYWAGNNPFISFSGGFDTRVILSSLLKQGIKPNLITRDSDNSFDVMISRQIASKFGLNHDVINMDLDDFFTHASDISVLTNGSMTARHWHTYIYPHKTGIGKENTFYVGTLGEFARLAFLDKGFLSKMAAVFPEQAIYKFWKKKLGRNCTFTDEELKGLAPEFRAQLDDSGRNERSRRLIKLFHHDLLSGFARWVIEQRVPNFNANGVKMYLASTNWVSPFHSREWISEIWRLGDEWKFGSNWHRYAIEKNFPELLAFQEKKGAAKGRMLPRAPLFYWSPIGQYATSRNENVSENWYRSDKISKFLIENIDEIGDVIDPGTIRSILASHLAGTDRTRALAFLLAMISWKLEVKKAIAIAN